jgi:hypothetical protein
VGCCSPLVEHISIGELFHFATHIPETIKIIRFIIF